jgi:eukaryotic-like serine/threonine-protein kinase
MVTIRRRTEDQVPALSLQPGGVWGNFTLDRKIGEGDTGEVYLARDSWLGHDVALKILRARVVEKARMLHEARMLVRVRHSHVVTVHGADVHGGRLGFWMDFVDGLTLKEVILRGGPRSAGEATAWGQDLCRALAAVHAEGIVHRDVKAQNVMRQTNDGRLLLMDFGAGELRDGTPKGAGAGAPLYQAPELLDGSEATRSSDIYALGVLLFHVVSMRYPFEGATRAELLEAHARGRRVRLEDVRPDLPSTFVDVVERALNRNPALRYASAGEMLAALRACSDTGPLQVTPLEPRQVAPGQAPAGVGHFVLRLAALGKAARLTSAHGAKRRVAGAVALILGLAQFMTVAVQ